MKISKYILLTSLFIVSQLTFAQKNVAISIDDVPNTTEFKKNNYYSLLLKKLDSISIPVAIFVNEGKIYKGDSINKNIELLNNWIKKEYITIGNHTFSHSRCSSSELDSFKLDILKGVNISGEIARKYGKSIKYFRFPYNDLGKDSIQQMEIKDFLMKNDYQIAPFTIESSDWMYNKVYKYYLNTGELEKAAKIGKQYVEKTLEYFEFFDSLSNEEYGHSINQIYLCHDSRLNADFLDLIILSLKEKNYNFISLDEAITDKAYEQTNKYYKKWGISWFYRWQSSQSERVKYMKKEPSTAEIETLYNTANKIPDSNNTY